MKENLCLKGLEKALYCNYIREPFCDTRHLKISLTEKKTQSSGYISQTMVHGSISTSTLQKTKAISSYLAFLNQDIHTGWVEEAIQIAEKRENNMKESNFY